MSAKAAKIILKPIKAVQPADGLSALTVDYGKIDEYFDQSAMMYDADRTAYLSSWAEDPKLPLLTQNWQRSARRLIGWAEVWFHIHKGNSEEQQTALDILDRITKDGGIRLKNLRTHIGIRKEALRDAPDEGKEKAVQKLESAEESADWFFLSALKTQTHFIDIYKSGKEYVPVLMKEQIETAEQFEKIKGKFPAGRLYSRAIIFPPAPIPMGEPVPQPPDVFVRYQYLPPEAVEYDPAVDELVIVPGYVSEDGLSDENSVIWHPENQTVEMGYRNGERVVWNFWKPKDTYDVPDRTKWYWQYQDRAFNEWLAGLEPGPLEPRPYESEPPGYNRIPDQ